MKPAFKAALRRRQQREARKERLVETAIRCATINALQNDASDEQAQDIEDLAVRAGLFWRCECGWVNDKFDSRCGSPCGVKRPFQVRRPLRRKRP